MSKRRFMFKGSTLRTRSRKGKPVWLWKWTKEAWHCFKEKQKKRIRKNHVTKEPYE